MEKVEEHEDVKRFVTIDEFSGGSGSGSGSGFGFDFGDGDGGGFGDGDGSGFGDGDGGGSGFGDGDGEDNGDSHIKCLNGQKVYYIDSISTLIDSVHGNYAKGRILDDDLTTKDCFIAKCGNFFAHGETLKQAQSDAREKYEENAPIEERIARFNEQYPDRDVKVPASELFSWHHILTGSCLMGRKQFCEEKGLDYQNGQYTVNEFIQLTRNAYGGNVIILLESTK